MNDPAQLPLPTILLVPGWGNSDERHWQTHWERDLAGARRVSQADWDHPQRGPWVEALGAAVEAAGTPVVLVAHSLGGCTVVHAAAEGRLSGVVGAFLVAMPDPGRPDFPPEIEGFAPLPAAPLPFPTLLVGSRNDPFLDLAASKRWARTLGARFADVGNRHHLGSQADLGPWPQGRRLFDGFLRTLAPGGGPPRPSRTGPRLRRG